MANVYDNDIVIMISMTMTMTMTATLISVKVTGMAIRQSQRSDKERLKISRFLTEDCFAIDLCGP